MKLIAWMLLVIICLMLSATVVGLVIAVPLFIAGTGMLVLSSVPSRFGWAMLAVIVITSIIFVAAI